MTKEKKLEIIERKRQENIEILKPLFSEHKVLTEVYENSGFVKKLKIQHRRVNLNTKFTIDHFYKFIKNHIEIEMIDIRTGRKIYKAQRNDNHQHLSLRYMSEADIEILEIERIAKRDINEACLLFEEIFRAEAYERAVKNLNLKEFYDLYVNLLYDIRKEDMGKIDRPAMLKIYNTAQSEIKKIKRSTSE